ncbi:glycosyltransferase family 4 protein [Aquicoccus sp. G2-2]|uniref:glycosyltransferase family 4 protein n=1 Tax=Aquicoccus sp. G2-2 TaxID=3092120 RepID=UPI002ADFA19E|nr:glycosyltransferase family 4 protein [Aquicoccus sp. G2-2]MEA1115220.1 glycosyltransferase family 4 protein [Aquicoccus sp. G2-2]
MTSDASTDPAGKKPRIVYLTQLFDPEPTFKGHDFVTGLEDAGLSVDVVTGFPNYPGGKVYDGYRIRPVAHDTLGNTKVTRLAMYPSHDLSALKRMATYTSFMVTSFFYLLFKGRGYDLIYASYPSLTAGLCAIAVKAFHKTPVILDIQDMWPDSLGASGMMQNRFLLAIVNGAINLLYRHCDHIQVLSPGFRDLLVERGVPDDKITIIYNWADEPDPVKDGGLPEGFNPKDSFRVLFAGNMGAAQDLDTAIEAAALLKPDLPGCVFYFMGGGIEKDRLTAKAHNMGLSNVRFLPRVPLQEVQRFLAAADALLVHLVDNPLYQITIPSKTQAYLYAGRPILMGVAGNASELVREANAGYTFPPVTPGHWPIACVGLSATVPRAVPKLAATANAIISRICAARRESTPQRTSSTVFARVRAGPARTQEY